MIPISEKLVSMLNSQVAHEIRNELTYRQISSWAHNRAMKGIASYFSSQADGEHSHADMIMGLLRDANVQLAIPTIEQPPSQFESCEMIASLYTGTEASTTDALEAISRQSDAEYDIAVQSVMQELLREQAEEEGQTERFANAVSLANGNLILLDLMFR